jgi:aspartate 4-decarboxylase
LQRKRPEEPSRLFSTSGRGNPNWIATTAREGFFLLGQFAITESKCVMEHPAGLGGMPKASGIAQRMETWLAKHSDMPGASLLQEMVPFAIKTFGFEPDTFYMSTGHPKGEN